VKAYLALGVAACALVYLAVVWIRKIKIDGVSFCEALFAGALLIGATHLIYCAFNPVALVHAIDHSTRHIELVYNGGETSYLTDASHCRLCNVHFDIGEWHFVELLVAGLFALLGAVILLLRSLHFH